MSRNEASWASPVCYGVKCAYSYVHVLHIRPFPLSWYDSTLCTSPWPSQAPERDHSHAAERIATSVRHSSSSLAYLAQSPAPEQDSPGSPDSTSGRTSAPAWTSLSATPRRKQAQAAFSPGPTDLIRYSCQLVITLNDKRSRHCTEQAFICLIASRRQVTTLTLEDEVAQMEAQLTRIREGGLLR